MSTYHFYRTSFRNFIWIKGGALFQDPTGLNVEMANKGAFALEVYDSDSVLVYPYRKKNTRGHWTSFYLNDTRAMDDDGNFIKPLSPGKYKFKLVNTSSGVRRIKQGSLAYD